MDSDYACGLGLIRFTLIAAGVCDTSLPSNNHISGNELSVTANWKYNQLTDKAGFINLIYKPVKNMLLYQKGR